MITKIQAINFGNTVVEAVLACRPESPLDHIKKDIEKQKLKSYFELFNVPILFSKVDTLINIKPSDLFLSLVDFIQEIRRLITVNDQNNQKIADYFFLSSSLAFIDITFDSIKQGYDKEGLLNLCYPFILKAIDISINLKIKVPVLFRNKEKYLKKNIDILKQQMKIWLNELNKIAKLIENNKINAINIIWKIITGIIAIMGGTWALIQLLRYLKIIP